MQPRSRVRGRDPQPPSGAAAAADGGGGGGRGGGRHRLQSPPAPPSPRPRHHRRPQRRTPPRRDADLHNDISLEAHHRILLEAGRLAAHYLVAQGVIPDHVLRARGDPLVPGPPQHPRPPASRGGKLDEGGDPRSRRNDGEWVRDWAWEDDDGRQARKSRWDRRSQSFDGRRTYREAGHDVDRGGRRTRDRDEPTTPPMSRSYSHNDRRPSADGGGVDPRRRSSSRSRSRSRTRTRTRSCYVGSSRDSDWRAGIRDLGHTTKVPGSGIIPPPAAADGYVQCQYGHVDEMPRQRRVPSSVVVAEVNGSADQAVAIEDGEMESEIDGLNHSREISEGQDGELQQDISADEDGEFAAARLNGEDGVEMDATHHQLADSDTDVHPSESLEEPVHRGSQLNNSVEDREAANAPTDACRRETSGEDNACTEASDEMVAPPSPQGEGETGVDNFNSDEPELPACNRIFDLNVTETPDAREMTEISGDPQADHFADYVPDFVGRIHQQTNYHASEIQGQHEHAGDNHMLKDGHGLIMYDLNSEAVEDAQDSHLLDNEKLLLSHGMDAHDTPRIHLCNKHLPLNQNAYEQEHGLDGEPSCDW